MYKKEQAKVTLKETKKYVKDKEHIKSLYGLDDTAFELWKTARLNTDIIHYNNPKKAEIGYKAYWDLKNYIKEHNIDDEVLWELAPDFAWDGGLSDYVEKMDKEHGIVD